MTPNLAICPTIAFRRGETTQRPGLGPKACNDMFMNRIPGNSWEAC